MDDELTICDRCSDEIQISESHPGPIGEWFTCTLCAVCLSEVAGEASA